jgi:hypothetical protein
MSIAFIRRWVLSAWPFALLVALAVETELNFPSQYDETAHLNFSRHIAQHPTWHTLVTYAGAENYEAKAPFVFILAAFAGSITSFTLPAMRLMVLAFACVGIWYFRRLVQIMKCDPPGYCSSSVVGIPYFLILALTFMTDMPTMALMFVCFFGLVRPADGGSYGHLWCSILASTAMLYTRIDAAFVLAGVGLACLSQGVLERRILLGIAIPAVLRLPLVVLWGGLAAPPARLRPTPVEAGLTPGNVAFSLCVIGLYFFPFALAGLERPVRLRVVLTSLAMLLFFAFMPRFDDPDPDCFGGTLRTLLVTATSAGGSIRMFVLAILLAVGCQVVGTCCWPIAGETLPVRAARISCLVGIATQAVRGEVMYERYLFPVFGFLYLLVPQRTVRPALWNVWFAGMIALQVLHLYMHHVL